ncbi:MAG: hypothetical protein KKF26_05765 [Chloroflexi bacterium]|nr:hypothetical protein [Chloroflexota bacterium]
MAKTRVILCALGVLLLLSLLNPNTPAREVTASSNLARWSNVNIPTEGKAGNWVLADGSDIQHLTLAADGTLYCYATPAGTSYTLFKSADGGYTWSYTGNVQDSIVDIATAPGDANIVYYATSANLYRSTDAGRNFVLMAAGIGGAGGNNVEITSVDVTRQNNYIIAVGTKDTDSGEYGGIYLLDESNITNWTDTSLGNYDAYAVAFAPGQSGNRQLVAVVTDETDTLVMSKVGDSGWGNAIGDAKLDRDNSGTPTPVAITGSAAIAFPDDYETAVTPEEYVQFVSINTGTGNGDVYRIQNASAPGMSAATDLNIGSAYGLSNIDIASVGVVGTASSAHLLAGATSSAQVYSSSDGGRNWSSATKEPTGQTNTMVLVSPNFDTSGRAYAVTSGNESAYSYTTDGGLTWNQLSLIDTRISDIVALAPAPNYSENRALFMLTHRTGGRHSLWRSLNDGAIWERTYSSALANVTALDKIQLSPQYGNEHQVVFLAGSSGNPSLFKSTDNGQTFAHHINSNPNTGASFSIDTWTVVDDNILFIGGFDGSNGLVYHTNNAGAWYSKAIAAGSQSLNSISLSPNYNQDKTILVGNSNGWIYWSHDDGDSFEPLPPDATTPPLTGNLSIAFDPKFASNNTVYAASDSQGGGIYRYIIGTSSDWESIDGTLPSNATIGELKTVDGGALYATNFKADGGMERCLNPTYPLGPTFETVTNKLSDGATLTGLWIRDDRLWSIDTTNNRVMVYIDSLARQVSLSSPEEKTPSIGNIVDYTVRNIGLDWEVLKGADRYRWQLDHETDFLNLPTGFEGEPRATSAKVPALEPATTYYWRVRAISPVLSPWSPTWSFTTPLGSETIAPKLISPEAGAISAISKPLFQWSAIDWGHHYEFLLSTDPSFTNPTIVKMGEYALPSTAWQSDIDLKPDTAYFWKVRATGSSSYSAWSAVGAFTTESVSPPLSKTPSAPSTASPTIDKISPVPIQSSAPLAVPSLPPSPPPPSPQPTFPHWADWLIYLGSALLLTMVAMLITLIILASKIGKL